MILEKLKKLDPQKLSPEQRSELADVMRRLEDAAQERSLLGAQEEAERTDPARLLDEAKRQAEEQELAAKIAQRLREGNEVWSRAARRVGQNSVALVRTVEGPIVVRSLTTDDYKQMAKRVEALQKDGKDDEANEVAESYIDGAVAYPPADEVAALCERYPLLRGKLLEVLQQLGNARAETSGKGD